MLTKRVHEFCNRLVKREYYVNGRYKITPDEIVDTYGWRSDTVIVRYIDGAFFIKRDYSNGGWGGGKFSGHDIIWAIPIDKKDHRKKVKYYLVEKVPNKEAFESYNNFKKWFIEEFTSNSSWQLGSFAQIDYFANNNKVTTIPAIPIYDRDNIYNICPKEYIEKYSQILEEPIDYRCIYDNYRGWANIFTHSLDITFKINDLIPKLKITNIIGRKLYNKYKFRKFVVIHRLLLPNPYSKAEQVAKEILKDPDKVKEIESKHDEIIKKAKQREEKKREEDAKKYLKDREEDTKKYLKDREKWLNHESDTLSKRRLWRLDQLDTPIRVNDAFIETSLNLKLHIKLCRNLYNLLKPIIDNNISKDFSDKDYMIHDYKVNSTAEITIMYLEGDEVKTKPTMCLIIGCHTITFDNIKQVAKQLNW